MTIKQDRMHVPDMSLEIDAYSIVRNNKYLSSVRHCIQKQRRSKNSYVLSKIISCLKFFGAFQLTLRGLDVRTNSNNPCKPFDRHFNL